MILIEHQSNLSFNIFVLFKSRFHATVSAFLEKHKVYFGVLAANLLESFKLKNVSLKTNYQ